MVGRNGHDQDQLRQDTTTIENYFHSIQLLFEPKYEAFRVMNLRISNMVVLMDDAYEAHGSLAELVL